LSAEKANKSKKEINRTALSGKYQEAKCSRKEKEEEEKGRRGGGAISRQTKEGSVGSSWCDRAFRGFPAQ
jgi:hypothetical protein